MTPNERIKRLKEKLGLSLWETALIFGCGEDTARQWISDRKVMSHEFHATLLRLECDNLEQLAPKLRKDTIEAFNTGRIRGRLENRNKLISLGATQ